MIDPKFLDELTERLTGSLPKGIAQLHEDFKKQARATLESAFARMDLVTREEFELQRAVLGRTRARLEQIERQLAELQARLNPPE